jgi:5''-nucleotidase/2'',3''-cyclic phosphodiesterase and related esterases
MMAGDSVGATPPISNSFGDTPTMEVMNMMGIDIDGLGNHNFDRGADYLRNTLIPIANFPFVSSNVVDAAGNTPAEWSKSHIFDLGRDMRVGFVGFTNDDASTLAQARLVRSVPGAARQPHRLGQCRGRTDRR